MQGFSCRRPVARVQERISLSASRTTFLAPFEVSSIRLMEHWRIEFRPTQLGSHRFSALAVPFRWMLSSELADHKDRRGICPVPAWVGSEREPVLCDAKGKEHKTSLGPASRRTSSMLSTRSSASPFQIIYMLLFTPSAPLEDLIVGSGRGESDTGRPISMAGEIADTAYFGRVDRAQSARQTLRTASVLPYENFLKLGARSLVRLADCVAFAPNEFFRTVLLRVRAARPRWSHRVVARLRTGTPNMQSFTGSVGRCLTGSIEK